MSRRSGIFLGLVFVSLGLAVAGLLRTCSQRGESPTPTEDAAAVARSFLDKLLKSTRFGWIWIFGATVQRQIVEEQVDPQVLVRGCVLLLENPKETQDTRISAIRLLGLLEDSLAVPALLRALEDRDEWIRYYCCYALRRLRSPEEVAERALRRLCREDPDTDVRVAAAFALNRGDDEDVLRALKLGLVGRSLQIRADCEDELERLGKLELPLPEHLYWEVSRDQYNDWKSGKRTRTRIPRETKKDGVIYFELEEAPDPAVPPIRYWYRTRAD